MGVAASIGLVLYFVCATASHLHVPDAKGIGPGMFMLTMAAAAESNGRRYSLPSGTMTIRDARSVPT